MSAGLSPFRAIKNGAESIARTPIILQLYAMHAHSNTLRTLYMNDLDSFRSNGCARSESSVRFKSMPLDNFENVTSQTATNPSYPQQLCL